MNIINKFFLSILLLPSGLYRRMGVSVPHLKAILTAKLIMDDRRPNSIHNTQQKKQKKPIRFATIGTMIFTAILGCVFLVSFAVGNDYLTHLTIYFSFYIFMLASTLISDFTSVLIDVRDNMIILPKPINDKTFVLARLLHIVIHVSKLILPMTLPGMILMGIREGATGLIPFIFLILAATLFTIFLINALYIFILKITTPEKFKNIISYFQIFFAINFYAGYQLVPRMISKSAIGTYSITSFTWRGVAPPYWFAASWQYLKTFDIGSPLVIYFILSIALPILSVWIVIKYFAPSFNQKLSMISGSEGETAPATANSKGLISTTSAYITAFANWFTEKGTERMSFLHTWKMTGRSRDFKMKVYPSMGYLLVYIVLLFMNNRKISFDAIRDQTGPGKFLFLGVIYFSSFVLIMALQQLTFSDKYKAAWIYYITPIQSPGRLLSGALKATIVKFYLPMVLLTSAIAIPFVGLKIIPNLLLGIFNLFLITTFRAYISMRELPFSTQQSNNLKGGNFIRGLFSMMITAILAVMHYFVYSYFIVIAILCVLSCIASWLMMDALKNKTWAAVQVREYEG
jgi:ABC-2 type transport system permease protein